MDTSDAARGAPRQRRRHGARAYWDGNRLVTEQAGPVQGETVSVKQVFALNGDGSEMTVETLLVVQHGPTLRGAKNYGAKTDVFTRTP